MTDIDSTEMVDCPDCDGSGELRHPRWGSYSCPEPYVTCRRCDGNGEVADDEAEDDPEQRYIDGLEDAADRRYSYLKDEGLL